MTVAKATRTAINLGQPDLRCCRLSVVLCLFLCLSEFINIKPFRFFCRFNRGQPLFIFYMDLFLHHWRQLIDPIFAYVHMVSNGTKAKPAPG